MITDAQTDAANAYLWWGCKVAFDPRIMRAALEAAEDAAWQPIETAPKDGTVVDLWIEGADDLVDFYAPTAKKVKGRPLRHGRAVEWRWSHRPPNAPGWYPAGGLGYPLAPEVRAVAWRPLPQPPEETR